MSVVVFVQNLIKVVGLFNTNEEEEWDPSVIKRKTETSKRKRPVKYL